jgi:hypothetical protein
MPSQPQPNRYGRSQLPWRDELLPAGHALPGRPRSEELVDETVRTLPRGLATILLAGVLLSLLIGFIFLLASLSHPRGRLFLCSMFISAFLGLMRIAAATRFFDSMVHFLLFPTGILFVFKYLDLIGSVRTVIWRRS